MAILAYSTPASIRAFSKYDDVKNRSDAELLLISDYTAMRINAFVGHTFESYTGVQTISGNDQKLITLPGKLSSLVGVSITVAGYTTAYPINNFTFNDNQLYIIDGTFTAGFMNIAINGIWGWADIPDEVAFCADMLAEEYCLQWYNIDVDTKLLELAPFSQQTIGAFSYKLRDPNDPALASTGNPNVDSILKKHKYSDGTIGGSRFFIEVI